LVGQSKEAKMMKLLYELLKDSSRSDRELGRVMGVSQPTISRLKKILLEKGLILGFTIIPDFSKMGYKLLVLTFVKRKTLLASSEESQKGHEITKEWMSKQPNIIFCDYCRGMDMDGFMISFHKSYEDFDKFIVRHNHDLGYLLKDVQNVLINIAGTNTLKPFHFKYLTEIPNKNT